MSNWLNHNDQMYLIYHFFKTSYLKGSEGERYKELLSKSDKTGLSKMIGEFLFSEFGIENDKIVTNILRFIER